jgi:phosphate transport system substrate-binding protein
MFLMIKRFLAPFVVFALVLTACGSNAAPTSVPATAVPATSLPATNVPAVATGAATAASTAQGTAAVAAVAPGPGSLSFSGGFALTVLVQKWSEEYVKTHADEKFDIQAGGAGKGITDVLAGATSVGLVTRALKKEEIAQGAVGYAVALDAVVVTINAANPVLAQIQANGLTKDQLNRVFIKAEKLTWGGLLGTSDTTPINVYTRSDAAGAADQLALYLGAKAQADIKGTAVNGDPGLAQAVAQDPSGIGFNSITFAYDPTTGKPAQGLAIVPLDLDGNGKLDPSESFYATATDINTAVGNGKYPNPPVRVLLLVTKGPATGDAKDFITWGLTDGQAFIETAGFVKLPADQLQASLDSIKAGK